MANGAFFKNGLNKFLISNSVDSMHYRETITTATSPYSLTIYGGYKIWIYTFTCPVFPLIFFEVTPYPTSIARMSQSGNVWTVEVLTGGINESGGISTLKPDAPVLKIFTNAANAITAVGTHGMAVYKTDSSKAFDSRKRPMAILHTSLVTPPAGVTAEAIWPPPGGPEGSIQSAFCQGDNGGNATHSSTMNADAYTADAVPIPFGKPLYCSFTAVHQHEREANYNGETTSGGHCSGRSTTYWVSKYWALYRSAIYSSSWTGGYQNIKVGWALQDRGFMNSSYTNTFNGWSGSSNSNGSHSGGKPPLTSETINNIPAAALFIDGSLYYG